MATISYVRTNWRNNLTQLNALNLNNIEIGLSACVEAINSVPNWALQPNKPTYTAAEVGADISGAASTAVNTHNASSSSHSALFNAKAPIVHTHTLSQITNFPVVSAADNDYALTVVGGAWSKKKLATVAFSGVYSDLTSKPTVPTATSQLTNDSGYVTLDDIRRTSIGQWVGGAITQEKTFSCGFYPSYITIVEKNGDTVISTQTLISSYITADTSIIFTDTGFTAQSTANGTFNRTNYTYYYTAVSEGFKSLPSVTTDDNGKLLTVVSGAWVASDSVPDEIDNLDERVSALEYVPIAISTFSNNVGTVELGSTITDVAITFATNKSPTTLTLDGTSIAGDTSPKMLTGLSLTTNKTYTLVAGDGTNTATKTTSITFLRGVYYGAAITGTLNSAFVLALSKSLQSTKTKTFTVSAGANQYIWYACPSSYGDASFKVGGFDGGFSKVDTIAFTNASGHEENYDIYRSDNSALGSTTVSVS